MVRVVNIVRRVDWILFLSVAILASLGLLAIWSVDLAQDPGQFLNFKKQLTFVAAGVLIVVGLAFVDVRASASLARPLYVGGLLLLAGLLVFGTSIRGTKGWFLIGQLTVQPVEFIKVLLIIALAKYLALRAHIIDWKVILNAVLIAGLYVALVLAQPDFGSALVLVLITVGMLLLTSVPRRYLAAGILIAALLGVGAWHFVLADYQKDRLISFIQPGADPLGRGYNIRQSVIAVGAGGFWGRGLGQGSQSQLRFLPEAQTDFIFAVLAEQLGFFVVVLIIVSYSVILWRCARMLRGLTDGFALFCVAGFLIMISTQAILNIGMNVGLLPIVGLPLPFVSLGGSALLANFLMLGIVQSIRVRG